MGNVDYLLDTHTFLWAVRGSDKLSETAIKIIEDVNVKVFVSAVSAYEIMNKYRMGKLAEFDDIAKNYLDFVKRLGVDSLPISEKHAHFAGEFEWTHRDPFDRLLAAQAFSNNLTLITSDTVFAELAWVKVLW
ncbi:MAG: type II toxin-antitoxin system VapC family toxin [Defluviitaleaceae bacterium]|nr:type II toxin-antitoxin system VapC family toxin [Defluviitaleaceae bacterium]MCL2262468.1 type II toxin-antitoxin system VapC family toxin [Defluviitaleaceae bacterium]